MPKDPKSRKPFQISDSLHRRLNAYAQMASAAGVTVLALAGASDAKVIYTEAHRVTQSTFPLYIDLNHDGIKDFIVRTSFYQGSSGLEVGLSAAGYRNFNNAVAGGRFSNGSGYFVSAAYALHAGARIGPKANFSARLPIMAVELFKGFGSAYSYLGAWAGEGSGVTNRYLGFKFVILGEVHYGWARFNVALGHTRQFDDVSGTLTGYAYETVPNKPIIAGQITGPDVITVPETLGGLALGRK